MTRREYCDCHEKHTAALKKTDDFKIENREDHKKMWDSIDIKINTRLFIWIVGIMIGFMTIIGGTQIKIMGSLGEIDKRVSIINTNTKHLKETFNNRTAGYDRDIRDFETRLRRVEK